MVSETLKRLVTRASPVLRREVLGAIVVLGVGLAGYRNLFLQPKVISPEGPALGITEISNTKPLIVVFNHPVRMRALHYAIHPDLAGTWKLSSNYVLGRSTLTFTPGESPDLDTRYTVELSAIQGILGGKPQDYLMSFQTDSLPTVLGVNIPEAAVDIRPDTPITFALDKPLVDAVVLTASLAPDVAFDAPTETGNTVTFTHAEQLHKSTRYVLKAFIATAKTNYSTKVRTVSESKTEAFTSSFTTVAAPGVQSYSPNGSGVDVGSIVKVEFQQAMDHGSTEKAFSLSPAVAGEFSWNGDQNLAFTPKESLTKGQPYTVTVAGSAKAQSGFTLEEDFSFTFTTIGAVTVSFSPSSGASGVDVGTTINAIFNQEVNHGSAESKFSVAPAVNGTFSWSGTTLVFHPGTPLEYNQSYTATVADGVQSVKGLDSTTSFSGKFSTKNRSVLLNVPSYRQAHMYSCMIAAARDAMAFRGTFVSESQIIARVGQDPTSWSGTWGGDNGVWGDPNSAMVGPLDNGAATSPAGRKTTNVYWGYGSHWGPISRVLSSYGIANEVRSGMTVQDLAQSVSDGNPVIIWWVNGIWPSYVVNWKTPDGKSVRGVNGLHVQVVRGFAGSIDNPTSLTVTDSGYGYPGRTFDIGTFKAKWGWFGNTGIIVK